MALRWTATADADHTIDAILGLNTSRPTSRTSGRPCRSTGRRRRTSSTPTSTATSATSSRAPSRSGPTRTTVAIARSVATTAAANGSAGSLTRTCPGSSIPSRAGSSPPTTPRSTRDYPYLHRPGVGSRLPGRTDHRPRCTPYGDGRPGRPGAWADPDRHRAAPRRARSLPSSTTRRRRRMTAQIDRGRGSPAGTGPATSTAWAARRTAPGSTGSSATSSTTSSAASPATTSAARTRGWSLAGLLEDPSAAWWDDAATPDVVETWRGGRRPGDGRGRRRAPRRDRQPGPLVVGPAAHGRPSARPTLGESGIGPLEWYFNDGPHAVPGSAGAVNNTYYRFSRAYPDPDEPDYRPVGIDRRLRR